MPELQTSKQRIKQIFEYLKALNEHRNPSVRQIREQPWSLWLDDFPRHPSIEFPQRVALPRGKEIEESGSEPTFVLRVRRPKLTTPPTPPDELRDWLLSGWDDPFKNADVVEAKNVLDANGETLTIRFADDPGRPTALAGWLKRRDDWKEAELPARAAMAVFDKLYALHGTIEREGERYDLVVGDGILSWQQQDGSIYHPTLLQRVQLMFDPKKPEFRIVDADVGSELYTGLFQSVADVDPRVLRSQREEFEEGGYHPLDQECSGVLEGFVNQLSAQGAFVGSNRPPLGAAHPTVGRSAVLFLRSRTKGFGTAIQRVIESIEDRDDFCNAFHNIVGCGHTNAPENSFQERTLSHSPERTAQDVLFGKPANPEQLRIARTLDRHGSVLVQGPPGTGKSHTIANLIGHLLANNQSVLVTSHTTKALRVLRNHLVEELRPLCVSVLESDLDSRQQLEQSVQAISRRLGESDADLLEREAGWLENERSALIERMRTLQEQLKNARADEYRDVIYGGKGVPPSDAARTVTDGRGLHDWIPGPVALGEPCPLSIMEVQELYATNQSSSAEDDQLADHLLPEASDLPTPQVVASLFRQSEQLAESGQLDRRYWSNARFTTAHISQLDSLITDLQSVVTEFASFDGWKLAAVDAGRSQLPDGGPWNHLLLKIDEATELARLAHTDIVVHGPEVIDESSLHEQRMVADELLTHLSTGGTLGWMSLLFRASWKQALSTWRVKGKLPETAEQVTAIKRLIAVRLSRADLRLLWDRLMSPHGAPEASELGGEPERSASQFSQVIRNAFEWWCQKWLPLERRLRDVGFDWSQFIGEQPPDLNRYGEMRRIMEAVRLRLLGELEKAKDHLRSLDLNKQMGDILSRLRMFNRPEVEALCKSLEEKDGDVYTHSYQACVAAAERRKRALRRRELLAKMARPSGKGHALADGWAEAIRQRRQVHGGSTPPGDALKAWEWRQLNDELDHRAEVDLEDLGRQIQDINDQLKRLTNQLIDRRAWVGQVRRTGTAQRQSLMGWLSIVTRIGRGFGRRVPQLRREAQQKMEECRDAVPVWIMPLSRLVENFDFSEPRFDVVIIDEASQCDVMALMALAIARKVVVVGDDKQVSPTAVGQKVDIIDNLIKLHLEGIPNAVLYDGKMSIYDLAKQSFSGVICLLEHFRCVPDIIQFSNHLSYDGTIKPLREQASSPFIRNVVPYRVEGGVREDGKVNPAEAVTIASLIVAASKHPAYARQTFGVISLVGDEQAMEIERLLLRHLTPDEYDRRRIVCGNSAQFQGDERHVMFLSVVDSPGHGPLRMSDRDETKQRYNVAASRAQNQTWVVYSLNYEVDLQPKDLRRRLIEHAIDPKAISRELEESLARTESPFEQDVCERLVRQGYRVRPQWQVGRYRIDLVVEGQEGRVAVECDGDRYHPIEKLPEDMERQAILERLGWRFVRIRGSEYFRDRESTITKVVAKLNEFGVFPTARDTHTQAGANDGNQQDPVEDVIRLAAELRSQWEATESYGDVAFDAEGVDEADVSLVGQEVPSDVGRHVDTNVTPLNDDERTPNSFHAPVKDVPENVNGIVVTSQNIASVRASSSPTDVAREPDSTPQSRKMRSKSLFGDLDAPDAVEATTLPTLQQRIVQLVQRQPGLKGREIASALRADKREVNSILHRQLSSQVRQDEESRWWPR
jgi:very-short-patch-repair endonuclease